MRDLQSITSIACPQDESCKNMKKFPEMRRKLSGLKYPFDVFGRGEKTLDWTLPGPTSSRLLTKIRRANLIFEELSKRHRVLVECFPVHIFGALIALLPLVRCINSKSSILKLFRVVPHAKDRYTHSACIAGHDTVQRVRRSWGVITNIYPFQSRNLTYFTTTLSLVSADQAKGYVFDRCKHHEQSRLWKEGSLRLLSVSKTEEGM
jgi:hypothetical protein